MDIDQDTADLRTRILYSAQDLFIQHGFHGLAMRQIAEALDVSKAALYYHYRDKEELFVAILETYLSEMEATLINIQSDEETCRKRLQLFIQSILTQPVDKRAIMRLVSQEIGYISPSARKKIDRMYDKKFISKIRAIIRSGIESAELRQVDVEVATWSLLGMIYPYTFPSKPEGVRSPEKVTGEILSIYFRGVANAHANV
jgi:AcrR family transcriptional regulator